MRLGSLFALIRLRPTIRSLSAHSAQSRSAHGSIDREVQSTSTGRLLSARRIVGTRRWLHTSQGERCLRRRKRSWKDASDTRGRTEMLCVGIPSDRSNESHQVRRGVDTRRCVKETEEDNWPMRIDYGELKRRIRLIELLERIGWTSTEGRGDHLRSPCPLPGCSSRIASGSNAHKRSLSVHPRKNVYRCFGCGSCSNVLDFWQAYRGKPLREAMTRMSRVQCGV